MDVLLHLDHVAVRYKPRGRFFRSDNGYTALKDVSFSVFKGETLGVVGRNGAGKSTLLKILAGIIEPDKGVIQRNNAKVSLLALQAGFDKELTGKHNIILSGLLLGFSRQEIESAFEEIISFSELGDAIERPVKTYSTGMRARLGFSIAFQLKPDVLLVDEVLGVGDIEFKQKSVAAMKDRMRSEQTIVLVSHHGQTIKNLCRRAIWIEDGIVKAEGDASSVVDEYEAHIVMNS